MNKGRRHELKMLHFRRRMKKFRRPFLRADGYWKTFAYRSHSTPCSCTSCRGERYSRAKEKERAKKAADPISEVVITYRAIVRQTPFVPAIEGAEEEEAAMKIIRDRYFVYPESKGFDSKTPQDEFDFE